MPLPLPIALRASLALLLASAACATEPPPEPGTADDAPSLPPEVTAALDLPATPYPYASVVLPAHFQSPLVRAMDNTPADNPISDDGATLGRVLFYDRALSQNRTIACASCHDQAHAFVDPARFSVGFDGGHTTRNSMPITDARFYQNGRFFWDQRAATLEAQVLMPIQNAVEMGLTLDELVARVGAAPYYPYLFERAFGDAAVTTDRIAKALAQFARSLVSYRSRYDAGLAAAGDVMPPFPGFTPEENLGKDLFLRRGGCASCHLFAGPPRPGPRPNQAVFFIDIATVNGLDATTGVDDRGAGDVTGRPQDLGRFKSPSLRNAAITAPYMHDGRLATLADVVEHYRTGVQPHPNLDPRLRDPRHRRAAPRGAHPRRGRRARRLPGDAHRRRAARRPLVRGPVPALMRGARDCPNAAPRWIVMSWRCHPRTEISRSASSCGGSAGAIRARSSRSRAGTCAPPMRWPSRCWAAPPMPRMSPRRRSWWRSSASTAAAIRIGSRAGSSRSCGPARSTRSPGGAAAARPTPASRSSAPPPPPRGPSPVRRATAGVALHALRQGSLQIGWQ